MLLIKSDQDSQLLEFSLTEMAEKFPFELSRFSSTSKKKLGVTVLGRITSVP
jgi:hypothetical protein